MPLQHVGMNSKPQLIDPVPLSVAARILRVPARWLREEIVAGRIPGLIADRHILVHVPTALAILAERAKGGANG